MAVLPVSLSPSLIIPNWFTSPGFCEISWGHGFKRYLQPEVHWYVNNHQWQRQRYQVLSGCFSGPCGWVATNGKTPFPFPPPHQFIFSVLIFVSAVGICCLQLSHIFWIASLCLNYFSYYVSCLLKVESRKFASWGLLSAMIMAGDPGPSS